MLGVSGAAESQLFWSDLRKPTRRELRIFGSWQLLFRTPKPMKMRYTTVVILLLVIYSCGQSSLVDKVEKEKLKIESQLKRDSSSLITLVKIYDQTVLKKVINKNWPENVETTYNILKNSNGQVILVAEFPTSESGDWILGFEHYFSDDGKLIAYEKRFSFFNDSCGDGLLLKKDIELYDNNFNIIKKTSTLRDGKEKEFSETECGNDNDRDDSKRATVKELLELKKIRL